MRIHAAADWGALQLSCTSSVAHHRKGARFRQYFLALLAAIVTTAFEINSSVAAQKVQPPPTAPKKETLAPNIDVSQRDTLGVDITQTIDPSWRIHFEAVPDASGDWTVVPFACNGP